MNFFKPAEIRAILVLSILVFLGSSLTLLMRQGKLSSLNLETFLDNSRYNYSYRVSDLPQKEKSENAKTEVADQRINEEPDIELEILDLNSAGFFELQTLPGIGPVLAERIIAYRDSAGAFKSPDELLNVSGIGEKKYAKFKDRITVN